jgi:hypothetical protein
MSSHCWLAVPGRDGWLERGVLFSIRGGDVKPGGRAGGDDLDSFDRLLEPCAR